MTSATGDSPSNQHILRFLGLSVGQAMLLFAGIVGIASGLAATGFYWILNEFVQVFLQARPEGLNTWTVVITVLSPALGGLICGLMLHYWSPDARGGVAEVIEAILHRGGRIRPRVGLVKALASAICIGSGGSAGREGPVVQIGASVGSTLARIFRVTTQNSKLLVACGAAGGIAAVFNAPIGGAFFAAEIITGRFEMKGLTWLFTASAMGAAVARSLLHNRATFDTAPHELLSIWALLLHAVLGVFCACLGNVFVSLLHKSEVYFASLRLSHFLRPALGGLIVGLIGLAIPQVFGTGGELLQEIFAHPVAPGLLLLWMLGKLIATPLTLGSGGSGGDLMPSLFLGASLGGIFGHWIHLAFPLSTMAPSAYALVGATALFAGVAHAPMTAIILGFEMGRNYGLILPLMVSCSVSALVAKRLRKGSLYTEKLINKGVDVDRLRNFQPDPFDLVQVSEVMTLDPISVSPKMSLQDLSEKFISTGLHGLLVLEDEKIVGIVTVSDVQRAMEQNSGMTSVLEIATSDPIVCYAHDTLNSALARLGGLEVGRMPVVFETHPSRAIGILSRTDIVRGYSIGLSRRE